MYFHAIIKNKNTFDVADFPFCTGITISGTNIVVSHTSSADLSDVTTTSYAFATYYAYVIPKSEV